MDVEGHSDQYRPLGGYLALVGAFNALAAVRAGRRGPGGPGSRTRSARPTSRSAPSPRTSSAGSSASDRVTSAVRAPFTRFQEDAGHGEDRGRRPGAPVCASRSASCSRARTASANGWPARSPPGSSAHRARRRAVAAMFAIHAGADALQLLHGTVPDHDGLSLAVHRSRCSARQPASARGCRRPRGASVRPATHTVAREARDWPARHAVRPPHRGARVFRPRATRGGSRAGTRSPS